MSRRPTDRDLALALVALGFRSADARDSDVAVVQAWLVAVEREDPSLVLRGRVGRRVEQSRTAALDSGYELVEPAPPDNETPPLAAGGRPR